MKKIFFILSGIIVFASCQKQDSPEEKPTISISDANAITTAVKVWHAQLVKGQPPAPTSNTNLELDASSNNQDIKAIAGRYAIITPEVTDGNVAGYYLQINGSSSYFKIDYSKPRTTGRMRTNAGADRAVLRLTGDSTDYSDSAIVITIPDNIQPGEFCVTYCAYDAQGNISNLITTCITVASFGGDASSAFLTGNWHITGTRDNSTDAWDVVPGNDTSYNTAFCENNFLSFYCNSGNCPEITYPDIITYNLKSDLSLASNGGMNYTYEYKDKYIIFDSSACNNFSFYPEEVESDKISGAWTYNSTSKKFTLVFDLDSFGDPDPDYWETDLIKISDTKIYLKDADDYWLRLEK